MRSYKRHLKYVMFLLPALIALAAYTTLYDRLYHPAPCLTNCDDYTFNASRDLQLNFNKILDLVSINRQKPASRQPVAASTRLDLAFLQEKLATTLHSAAQHLNDTPSSASMATLIARDLNNEADPIGLTQVISGLAEKPSITQPDSLAASINGLNPPIIIAAKEDSVGNKASPNLNNSSPIRNNGVGGIAPATASSNNPNLLRDTVQNTDQAPLSSVPLPNSRYLMMAGLMVVLAVNYHAKKMKEDF